VLQGQQFQRRRLRHNPLRNLVSDQNNRSLLPTKTVRISRGDRQSEDALSAPRPEPKPDASSCCEPPRSRRVEGSDPAPLVHDAVRLLGGGRVALIVLGDQTYQLRLTRAGKLILNK
jgi:hemin uptake protein HemP